MKTSRILYSDDPITEVRQIREEIVAEHGDNLHELWVAAMRRQKQPGRTVVNLPQQKAPPGRFVKAR